VPLSLGDKRDDKRVTSYGTVRFDSIIASHRRKCFFDALQGVLYIDDGQIVRFHGDRHDDPLNPRVEVEVRPYVPGTPLLLPLKREPWQDLPPADIRALKESGPFWGMFPDPPK